MDRATTTWTSSRPWGVICLGAIAVVTLLVITTTLSVALLVPDFESSITLLIARSILTAFGICVLIRQVFLVSVSVVSNWRGAEDQQQPDQMEWPLISVLLPAYNEGENIVASLTSLLNQDYPNLELIVIDDGSQDETLTLATALSLTRTHHPVTVLHKTNGGKASALNLGFTHSSGELVMVMDADSRIAKNALKLMLPKFQNPKIDAVAGQVAIGVEGNFITQMQAIEYAIANGTTRTAQSLWQCVLLVPGPIGLFRRSALERLAFERLDEAASAEPETANTMPIIEPISDATFAEDFETSIRVLANGGGIVYEPRALCYTRPPSNVVALVNQRYRWIRGHLQVGHLFMSKLWSPGDTRLRLWMWLTCLFDLYVMPFATIIMFFIAMTGFLLTDNIGLWLLVIASTLFAFSTILAYTIASQAASWRLLVAAPAFAFYQIFMLSGAFIIAFIDDRRRASMRW